MSIEEAKRHGNLKGFITLYMKSMIMGQGERRRVVDEGVDGEKSELKQRK